MVDKKTTIIDATISAVAKYGLNKTNAQVVASEMGIAQSSVFYHFPHQQQLFESLVPRIAKINAEEVKQWLKKTKPENNFDRLCEYIHGNLIWAKNNPSHVIVLMYSLAEGQFSESISHAVTSILKMAEERIYFYLVAGVAEKEFTIEGNLRSLSKFICQSVNGTVVTQFQLYGDWQVDEYMAVFTQLLKQLIQLT